MKKIALILCFIVSVSFGKDDALMEAMIIGAFNVVALMVIAYLVSWILKIFKKQ
ncbi:hypothetical protein ACWIUD_08155 [Helicobacter sp. 23-1044]